MNKSESKQGMIEKVKSYKKKASKEYKIGFECVCVRDAIMNGSD